MLQMVKSLRLLMLVEIKRLLAIIKLEMIDLKSMRLLMMMEMQRHLMIM